MNFIFKLQHIAVVKIATTLWIQDDMKNIMIKEGYCKTRSNLSYKSEEKIRGKVTKLPLPEFLKEKILDVIKQIFYETIFWKIHCRSFLPLTIFKKAFINVCWTYEGMVNEKMIAEVLIKDEELDITGQYELACIYCLESDIERLWKRLSVIDKKNLFKEYGTPDYFNTSDLVVHWTLRIQTTECTSWKYAFECAVIEANIAATKYFLQKLTPEEKEQFLVPTARNILLSLSNYSSCNYKEYSSKVFTYLLSQMSEKQQMEIFETNTYGVLSSLLSWPYQNFFLETAERLWSFLTMHEFMMLNNDIIDKAFPHVYHYDELLRDFWHQSPIVHKNYMFDNCSGFLKQLFEMKDLNSIKWILKDASPEVKSKIILCDRKPDICRYLMENEKWNSLEFFIRECLPPMNDMPKLKGNLENLLLGLYDRSSNADKMVKLKRFFKLLLEEIRKVDKKEEIRKM